MWYLQSTEGMAKTAHDILLAIADISSSKVFSKSLHYIVIIVDMSTLNISDPAATHPTTSQSIPTKSTIITIFFSSS